MNGRRWIGVYVETDEDAGNFVSLLGSAKATGMIPTLDWDSWTECEGDGLDDYTADRLVRVQLAIANGDFRALLEAVN